MNETSTELVIVHVDQLDSICRTCLCNLKESVAFQLNSHLLIPKDSDPKISFMLNISTILSELTSIPIDLEDTLPKNLCQQCLFHLSHAYQFISKCKKSENLLKTILKSKECTQKDAVVTDTKNLDLPEENEVSQNINTSQESNSQPIANVTKQEQANLPIELDLSEKKSEITKLITKKQKRDLKASVEVKKRKKTLKKPSLKKNTVVTETEKTETTERDTKKRESNPKSVGKEKSEKPPIDPYCDFCDLRFENLKKYREHKKTIKHPMPKVCQCEICLKAFVQRSQLTIHMRRHTNERPFCCKLCPAKFTSSIGLRRHGVIHTDRKPIKCEYCSRGLSSRSALTVHIRTHTGERPYVCIKCGKSFKQLSVMNQHFQIHQPKPKAKITSDQSATYECTICARYFSSNQTLLRHNYMQHNPLLSEFSPTNEKLFKCQDCDKIFHQRSYLLKHIFTHTGERPYSCKICQRRFAQRASLMLHERFRHTKERPFICTYCGKGFATKAHATQHERIHTGEKPFKCSVCDMAFYSSASRRNHMVTRHLKVNEKTNTETEVDSKNM